MSALRSYAVPPPAASGRRRPVLSALLAALCAFLLFGAAAAGAQTLSEIATELDQNGVYTEQPTDADIEQAIQRANDASIAFAWLDQGGTDPEQIAIDLLAQLNAMGSSYRTVVVLGNDGVWVQGDQRNAADAADAALSQFGSRDVAGGLDTVTGVITGSLSGQTTATTTAAADAGTADTNTAATASSGGVPWFLIFILAAVAFFGFRFFAGKRRASKALAAAIAEDKAEIREQLRNNADAVIDLGDRIANADDELRQLYEKASRSYTEVSQNIDDAETVEAIDALDDRIDEAEWQFQVIEARLDGRTPPPRPEPDGEIPPPPSAPSSRADGPSRPDGRQPVPPLGGGRGRRDGPALGSDESIFSGNGPRGQRYEQPRQQQPRRQQRRSRRGGGGLGGMLGGAMKAGLGTMLLRMLLGGGLGALGGGSRRTQRRTSSRGGRSSGGFGGGLGGGVLRGR